MDSILTRLPLEERGYAVELDAGKVHTRYPKHETGDLHRTSHTGLLNMLVDRELTICRECYAELRRAPRKPKAAGG